MHRTDPDYSGNAVSNASFSKVFGPGLRLGWLEAPTKVRDTILSSGVALSGGSFNHVTSGIMTSIIEMGLMQTLLKEVRPIYQVATLSSHSQLLPLNVDLFRPSASHCVAL